MVILPVLLDNFFGRDACDIRAEGIRIHRPRGTWNDAAIRAQE